MSLAPSEMHLCVCGLMQLEHANEIYNHSKRTLRGQNEVVGPIVLERRAFSRQDECDLMPRERETKFVASVGLSGVRDKVGISHSAPKKSGSHRFVGTGGCRTTSKLQPSAMTEALRTCSRVRLCELATQCSLCSAMLARGPVFSLPPLSGSARTANLFVAPL